MDLTLDQALQKGVEAHKAGKVQEADRYYTAILKSNPKHPDANHNMGVLAVGVGKVDQALPFFKTALEANPKIAQFWLSYVDALIKLNRMDDAKSIFDKAKSHGAKGDGFDKLEQKFEQTVQTDNSGGAQDGFSEAVEFRESGQYTEAIEVLKSYIGRFPKDPNLLALLAHCHILKDDIDAATMALSKAKEIDPNLMIVGWNEVRLLLKKQNVFEALSIAKALHKKFPDDVEGMGVLGSCLRANGDLNESLEVLNQAILREPNYAEAYINRGLIWLSQEDKSEAASDFEKAYQIKPYIKQIWDLIIQYKVEQEQYKEAISLLINMIEIDPGHKKSFALLAVCSQKANDIALAIMSFKKVLEVVPNDAFTHVNLGIALRMQGETEEAVANFTKALSIKTDYPEAYFNMGVTLKDQGKLDEAIKAYGKAISIKPDYVDAYNNMGNALNEQGKHKEAIVALKAALSIKPEFVEACNNMANALKEQGSFEEAIGFYNKALSIKPDYPEAIKNASEILKIYSPKTKQSHILFDIDTMIKKVSDKLITADVDAEITDTLSEVLSFLNNKKFNYKTPLSQIFKRSSTDLNCNRHMKIFDTENIIPEFCFGCIKIQVEVDTFIQLVKLTNLFYRLRLADDLTRKTMIELRPNISGFFKGLIYCKDLEQASLVKNLLDVDLKNEFDFKISSQIKRGCSEFSQEFPEYGTIINNKEMEFKYPKNWQSIEDKFDQREQIIFKEKVKPSFSQFCVSDICVIRKWIDYAKGLNDPSTEFFSDQPIIFHEIYEIAAWRKKNF